eukprot:Skav205567  [mRNA]  locus=scaffold1407:62864:63308:- [translate_table: standard]
MAKALGILLLIPVLAEKACHEGSCDDSALMQMNRNKENLGPPWWVWKKILEDEGNGKRYPYPTPPEAPAPSFLASMQNHKLREISRSPSRERSLHE